MGACPNKTNWKPQGLLAPILRLWNSWSFIPFCQIYPVGFRYLVPSGTITSGQIDLFPPSKSHLWKTMVKVLTLHQVSGCNDKYIQLKFSCIAVQQISVMDLQVSSYAFGQMPPDASDFPGGIPALGVVSARASLLLSAKTDCSGVRDKGCDWCWQFRIFEFSD